MRLRKPEDGAGSTSGGVDASFALPRSDGERSGVGAGGDAQAPPPPRAPAPSSRRSCGFIPRPLRVLNIVGNEAMERLAFYGVRAVLVLYLTQALGMSPASAVSAFSLFSAVAYISPLAGGYLADAVVGKLRTILAFNVLYLVGLLVVAAS